MIDIAGQPGGDPRIGVKKVQLLDMNAFAMGTEHFAIPAGNPRSGCGKAQIPDGPMGPAVNSASPLTASLTDGLESFVGLRSDVSHCHFWRNCLTDNFDSTKGEIGCYTGYGHRRPPWVIVFLGKKTLYPSELPDVHSVLKTCPFNLNFHN
jgi:hypothetical protein